MICGSHLPSPRTTIRDPLIVMCPVLAARRKATDLTVPIHGRRVAGVRLKSRLGLRRRGQRGNERAVVVPAAEGGKVVVFVQKSEVGGRTKEPGVRSSLEQRDGLFGVAVGVLL